MDVPQKCLKDLADLGRTQEKIDHLIQQSGSLSKLEQKISRDLFLNAGMNLGAGIVSVCVGTTIVTKYMDHADSANLYDPRIYVSAAAGLFCGALTAAFALHFFTDSAKLAYLGIKYMLHSRKS
jgi:hypothetical protein